MPVSTLIVIGAGSRGDDAYGRLVAQGDVDAEITGVAEPDRARREAFAAKHRIPAGRVFADWRDLFAKGKLADAALICSPDRFHFEQASAALKAGYHVLLEKPMAIDPRDCVKLGELAREKGRVFMICHVLRYSPFFAAIKDLLDSGTVGELMSIQHNECVGYWHFAHSFVRGNWRRLEDGSPLILAKSCHDLDILLWLAGVNCLRVASFGSLAHFRADKAPAGAAARCTDCGLAETCPYSALSIYPPRLGQWPSNVLCLEQNRASLDAAIKSGPYGRCVYHSDNDVVDHQSTILEFEKGITATFNLSAFTGTINRTIRLMGSLGEIRADMEKDEIEVLRFGTGEKRLIKPADADDSHGGGDRLLLADFLRAVRSGDSSSGRTGAEASVQSHLIAFAAEKARVDERVVDMRAYMEELRA